MHAAVSGNEFYNTVSYGAREDRRVVPPIILLLPFPVPTIVIASGINQRSSSICNPGSPHSA